MITKILTVPLEHYPVFRRHHGLGANGEARESIQWAHPSYPDDLFLIAGPYEDGVLVVNDMRIVYLMLTDIITMGETDAIR